MAFHLYLLKVESERAYHQRVLQILDQLEGEVCNCIADASLQSACDI